MNKTLNTILFIVASSIALSILILAFFFGLLLLLLVIFPDIDITVRTILLMTIFVVAVVGGMLIYSLLIKLLIKRFKLEKYLLSRKQQ